MIVSKEAASSASRRSMIAIFSLNLRGVPCDILAEKFRPNFPNEDEVSKRNMLCVSTVNWYEILQAASSSGANYCRCWLFCKLCSPLLWSFRRSLTLQVEWQIIPAHPGQTIILLFELEISNKTSVGGHMIIAPSHIVSMAPVFAQRTFSCMHSVKSWSSMAHTHAEIVKPNGHR